MEKEKTTTKHDGYTRDTREFLDQHGNLPILALSVVIVPLPFVLPLILNLATKREFNAYMKKKGFDRLYHWELMATIEVENEKRNVIIQKAGEIDINFDKKSYTYYYKSLISNKIFIDVPLIKETITIDTLLKRTRDRVTYDEYYKWSLFGPMNCQGFVKSLLESVDLYETNTALQSHYQSTVGDSEAAFIQQHSYSLFMIDLLAYMGIYGYILFRYVLKYIFQKLSPQFSKYMNF